VIEELEELSRASKRRIRVNSEGAHEGETQLPICEGREVEIHENAAEEEQQQDTYEF